MDAVARDGALSAAVHALSGRLTMSYERRAMTLLLLVYVLDYGDRTLIGALGPTLKRVYHINNTELGLVAAAFALVGAVASIPLGMPTDRVRAGLRAPGAACPAARP